ncbi:hypothetical protein GCM10022226_62590 [Sphaerisporangium flaviroseum]|uniref:WD40 repeat domain-containing protein n=1 Tax=Sphaerisporangium flaviroseum TaxID=509199 RepID=A0ABP7J3K5_9ACTN
MTGHTDAVLAVACTVLDGRPVAVTGSGDDTVRIWHLAEHRLRHVVALPSATYAVALGEAGQLVCTFGNDFAIRTRQKTYGCGSFRGSELTR